jgi:hypothetical protein
VLNQELSKDSISRSRIGVSASLNLENRVGTLELLGGLLYGFYETTTTENYFDMTVICGDKY